MSFLGLFIGVDRYGDPTIPWLAGARRDAAVAHALFTDTLGEGAELLVDSSATLGAIVDCLGTLQASATRGDVVVVYFAGHGTDDHHLVPSDGSASDLASSCISLDALADLLSEIEGEQLLCVLDCCFSGGIGARVLQAGFRRRDAASGDAVEDALGRFVGSSRAALTASAADEPALESSLHGHGLLTYRLLEALQGHEGVREGEQVNLLRLVDHVTRSVQADAAQMGQKQTPTLRGQFDGAQRWPVFRPGSRYTALVPEAARQPVGEDVHDLGAYGIDPAVLEMWSGEIPGLNKLQQAAVNSHGILDDQNVVVTAPTSSGKTLVGELAALKSARDRRRAVFLLPMRALVNDKYEQFTRLYGPAGVTTIRATGEHSDDVPALMRGQFDIALLTYEKYSALALGRPHLLDLAATVVIDEAQMLADRGRGSNLEFVLTMLNNRRGRTGGLQIVTLSAVVGDLRGLDRWLGASNLHSDTRPVPLVEGVLQDDGSLRYVDEEGSEQSEPVFVKPLYDGGSRRLLIPLARRLVDEGKKLLVFRQTKGEAAACATYLSQALGLPAATEAVNAMPNEDLSTSSGPLRSALHAGVAFHSTDLDREERRVVEEQFRDPESALRVVAATPTLAMGVNTPASAVAIVGLTHPGPQPTPYSVAEYKNMVGRAGRLGMTELGESFLIPEGALDAGRAWSAYVRGELESLDSQLIPDGDPRSLMLRVFATYAKDPIGAVSEDEVLGFLDSSFAAFLAREGGSVQWTLDRLERGFRQLVEATLIAEAGSGYSLTALGRFTGESGVHVDSIRRLVHAMRDIDQLNSTSLVAAAQLTNELDSVYLPVNARARNTEVPRWPRVLLQQEVPGALINHLTGTATDGRQAVSRTKRACAAAMWMSGIPIQDIEVSLTQHLRQRGRVAGSVRSVADRTRDLVPAVAAVARETDTDIDDGIVERTMVRLELGIPVDVAQLALDIDATLTRAQWIALADVGLTSPDLVGNAPEEALTQALGSDASAREIRQLAEAWEPSTVVEDPLLPPPVE